MWREVKRQIDIDELLEVYGYFHDSCIRDIYISTKEFVDEKRAMHFDNKLVASMIFQRQFKEAPILELKFEDVAHINFKPFSLTDRAVIYNVTLKKEDGLFYWADFAEWEKDDHDAVWISGAKLFWRLRPELIGNTRRVSED